MESARYQDDSSGDHEHLCCDALFSNSVVEITMKWLPIIEYYEK